MLVHGAVFVFLFLFDFPVLWLLFTCTDGQYQLLSLVKTRSQVPQVNQLWRLFRCGTCVTTVMARYGVMYLKVILFFYLCIEWSQKGIQGKRPRLIVKWCNLGRKRGGFFVYREADYRRTQFPGWGRPQKRPAAFRMGNLVWGSWFHVTLAAVGT